MASRSEEPRLPQPVADILESMTDAFVALDREWRYLYVNRRAGELFGRSPEDLVGRVIWEEFPEGRGRSFHRAYEEALREQRFVRIEDFYPPFGRWFENRIYPSPDGLTIFFQDITDRKLAELELARSEQRYRVLVHALSSVVWRTDAEGRPLQATDWEALTGREVGEAGDLDWSDAVHPGDRATVLEAWARALRRGDGFEIAYRIRGVGGEWRHIHVRGVPIRENGAIREWIGVIDDITDRVEIESALRRAALEDPLTGLPNRPMFLQHLAALLGRREPPDAAVLYVDVDRFKAVNDVLGHEGGDRLLDGVAAALRAAVRPSDVVSRLSGDEFAVLCDGLRSDEEAVEIARRLGAGIAAADDRMHVTASIGVAFARDGREGPEALLRAADAAMYVAKSRGGAGVEVYDTVLRERLRQRAEVEDDLRAGLEGTGFALHFQPILPFAPGAAATAEALLRWQVPGRPARAAAEVVSVAEQTGLIGRIGSEVLRRACRQAATWAGGMPAAVAVNVSARQLRRPDELVADVRDVLAETGLDPARLRLEITESVLMEDMQRGESVLATLRELGVALEIDDFGVGYSSLSYLHRLPVDAVKIDRSFIARLPHDRGSARIVEAVVGLARAFDVRVVAEGVETPQQLAAVRAIGCDAVQGFVLSAPVPPDALGDALAAARQAVAAG